MNKGPIPLELALDDATQMAEALAFAHEHGVIHRDIKPANVVITGQHGRVKLTVEAAPERVRAAFDRASRTIAKDISVPGFRKGKAPRRVVEQRVGTAAIAQVALDEALQEFFVEALRTTELDTVARPQIDVERFDEEDGCAFTVTVEVRPEITPADHHGITVSHPEWQVPDAAITAQLDRLREQFAEVEVVDRPAVAGDLVTLDLRLSVDGAEVESARVEGALYEVGSGGVTPELDRRALGASAGDVLAYDDELPESYPEHGGATATFTVTIADVREKRLPELDDDFADTAGGFDTLADMRADVADSLARRRILEGRHELRGVVTEAYVALHDVPVPPTMLSDAVAERLERLALEAQQFGGTLDELLQLEETSREDYEVRLGEQMTTMLRGQLVLDALARELGLTVQAADLDREFSRLGMEHRTDPKRIAELVRDQGTLPVLVGD
ncbi:MAG: trigger factor, partial [Actinomycetota bacterium]